MYMYVHVCIGVMWVGLVSVVCTCSVLNVHCRLVS